MQTLCRRRSAALTLIELVVVMTILIALAGLVIPQLANLGRQSDMAATGATQSDLANNLQLHFIQLRRYPTGMDSLLTTTGALFLPVMDATTGLQITGLPKSGPDLHLQLEVIDLATLDTASGSTSKFRSSVSRTGFDFVYDHDVTVVNANDSGTTRRPSGTSIFGSSATTLPVAAIKDGTAIAKAIYPATAGVIPTTVKLVAFGVGPSNSTIGTTAMNSPIYPGCDGTYYGRYVAIFKVLANGSRAQLAMVVDSYGRFPDYTQKQYNEMLPEGARRG
jgi:type II secretory pathway pseudopilin PulG